ncbi:hypothetical protein D3C81_1678890 [compost metagenome]
MNCCVQQAAEQFALQRYEHDYGLSPDQMQELEVPDGSDRTNPIVLGLQPHGLTQRFHPASLQRMQVHSAIRAQASLLLLRRLVHAVDCKMTE